MKKYVLLTAMVLALATPGVAWSQSAPPGNNNHGEGDGQDFQTHKAEILKRMNEHLAETQQRIACVQAAGNHEALRACIPQRGPGGMMMQHGGGQGGPGGGEAPGGER